MSPFLLAVPTVPRVSGRFYQSQHRSSLFDLHQNTRQNTEREVSFQCQCDSFPGEMFGAAAQIGFSHEINPSCNCKHPRIPLPQCPIPGKQTENRGKHLNRGSSGRSPRHLHSSSHFLFYYLKLRALISSQRNKSHSCSLVQVSAKRRKKKKK